VTGLLSEHDAGVIAALIALIGTLAALYVQQKRAHAENHAEHAATFELVREVAADVKEVRADQREQGAELRSHGDRLRRLEGVPDVAPEPVKPARIKPETRNRKRAV
jgi:hypothetical protein